MAEAIHSPKKALHDGEAHYRTLFERAGVGEAEAEADSGRLIRVNRKLCEMLHKPPEELIGARIMDLTHPEDRARDRDGIAGLIRGETTEYTTEKRYLRKDGGILWARTVVTLIPDSSGRSSRLVAIINDISGRKQAEDALRRSEEMFRLLAEHTKDLICLHEPDGRYRYVSPACRELLGYTPEEMLGRDPYGFFHPQDRSRIEKTAHEPTVKEAAVAGVSYRIRRKSGDYIWFETQSKPILDPTGAVIGLVTSSRDITDRKQAEESLIQAREESERHLTQLEAVFDAMSEGVVILDNEGNILRMNPMAQQLSWVQDWGEIPEIRKRFEALPETYELCDLDGVPLPLDCWPAAYARRQQAFSGYKAKVIRRKTGESWIGHFHGRPVLDKTGNPIMFVMTMRDVTTEVNAWQALTESEQRFRQVAESLPAIVWTGEPDGTPEFYNHQWTEYTGLDEQAALAGAWLEVMHPDDQPRILAAWRRALQDQTDYGVEYRLKTRNGDYRWFQCRAVPLRGADGRVLKWFGTYVDIHEHKQIEAELEMLNANLEQRVRERTADLEGFTYTVSHDLRAPVRAIEGFADALLEDYGDALDETACLYIRRTVGASRRMNELIDDLLAYSRLSYQEVRINLVSLDAVVNEVLEMLSGDIESAAARIRIDSNLPKVRAHKTTLVRVLENLVCNAIKFVAPERPPEVHIGACNSGDHVVLTVADNGIGIAPEHQERIFKVFERLHSHDKYPGTGIGLAIVRKSLERMGGDCGVESEPGQGSRFWIRLPKAQEN